MSRLSSCDCRWNQPEVQDAKRVNPGHPAAGLPTARFLPAVQEYGKTVSCRGCGKHSGFHYNANAAVSAWNAGVRQ